MLTQAGAWKVVIPVAVHRDHREVGQKMESKALVVKIFRSLVDMAHGLWLEGCELGPKPEVERTQRSARFFARFRKLTSDSQVARCSGMRTTVVFSHPSAPSTLT